MMGEGFFTTDFHVKALWGAIFFLVVGWSGGIAWSAKTHEQLAKEIQCVKYDTGTRLASIETSLKQINASLLEIKEELRKQ